MNTIILDNASVVSSSIKKDPTTGDAYLANIRIADSKYKSNSEKEKAKKEGKETDNFFTLNIWKNEIEKFDTAHKSEGLKIENLVPGCKLKITGHLVNNNYVSNGAKIYKDVIVADLIEILYSPKSKEDKENEPEKKDEESTSTSDSDVSKNSEQSTAQNLEENSETSRIEDENLGDIPGDIPGDSKLSENELPNPFDENNDDDGDLPF